MTGVVRVGIAGWRCDPWRGVSSPRPRANGRWPRTSPPTSSTCAARRQELCAGGCTPAALERWGERIRAWRDGSEPAHARLIDAGVRAPSRPRDVYCYFDNDAKVKAPRDAMRLARLLAQ